MVEVTVNGFQDKVIKGVVIFLLALSFETLTLEEGNCHANENTQPSALCLCPIPCGDIYVPRNGGLQPTTMQ